MSIGRPIFTVLQLHCFDLRIPWKGGREMGGKYYKELAELDKKRVCTCA